MFNLFLLSLTVWRIGSLVGNEDGPYKIFFRFREWAGIKEFYDEEIDKTLLVGILECFWCLSVWVAIGVCGLAVIADLITLKEMFFFILATSAISIMIEEKIF